MNIKKIIWGLRAVFYKFVFKSVGWQCYLGSPLFLLGVNKASLGSRVRIFPGVRMEVHGQGELVIEDNVAIGQNFHVICSSRLSIGSGTLMSANVFITDTDHTFDDIDRPIHEQPNVIKKTSVGKNCFLGYGVVIQAGTILEDGCVVGANSTIKGHFKRGSVIVGSPGRIIKSRNVV